MSNVDTLDATGLLCPLPVLKLRKRLKPLPTGTCIRLLADDPAAAIDVPHFCREAGHDLLTVTEESEHTIYLVCKRDAE